MSAHPFFALGKKPAEHDDKSLQFDSLVRPKRALPDVYDYDLKHPRVPLPMFANDEYGCCVISARAHQTLRLEQVEQKVLMKISDEDVVTQYLKESGGEDSGLIMLHSMQRWYAEGWKAGKKARKYNIAGFASIRTHLEGGGNSDQLLREAIFADVGVHLGLSLPETAATQLDAGRIWDVERGRGSAPNSWGGHAVYVSGYTQHGPVCVTWGRKQAMTWPFYAKYCDEAYAVFDAANPKQQKLLKQVKAYQAGL